MGDNGILDLSKAYRLKPGTGWLVPPCVLHAPGSLVTYEPQWGSDVFGMYQSMVEGRRVPWDLLVKDVPHEYHQDLDYLVEQLDWDKNVDPEFKAHNYLEPIVHAGSEAKVSSTSGSSTAINGQNSSAPRADRLPAGRRRSRIRAPTVCRHPRGGTIGKLDIDTPVFIRFGQMTEDEVFVADKKAGRRHLQEHRLRAVRQPPLLRPDTHPDLPNVGDHLKAKKG